MKNINLRSFDYHLDTQTKEIINIIRRIAYEIIAEKEIKEIKHVLEINSDGYDSWYSFVMLLDAEPSLVEILNDDFVENFISASDLSELNMKLKRTVIFRFESGKSECH